MEARCVEATKLVRKVYVRHPNYGDLVKGIEGHGLEGLEERVPVSVGKLCPTHVRLKGRELTSQEYLFRPCWVQSLGR